MEDCKQEERLRNLEMRIGIVETKVDTIKEDIREIKDFQSKIILWLIGTLASSLVTLAVLLFKR